jgi:hypothetical protein
MNLIVMASLSCTTILSTPEAFSPSNCLKFYNILQINLKPAGQKLVKLTTPTNNINTSKIASMSSTDLPNCINAKLNRYFKQLDGEKASGVLKMVVQEFY